MPLVYNSTFLALIIKQQSGETQIVYLYLIHSTVATAIREEPEHDHKPLGSPARR